MTLSSDRDGGIASPPRAKPCSMTLETSRLENIGGSTKPFTGRPGSGGRPLLALALAQNHRSLIRQLTAVRGSQYPALPPPERPSPPLMPVPSGLFHPGPVFRGSTLKAGWLYASLRSVTVTPSSRYDVDDNGAAFRLRCGPWCSYPAEADRVPVPAVARQPAQRQERAGDERLG